MKQCMDSANLHRRLAKIIGQIQAIDRMIDEDIPCEDILSQINAAKSALNKGRSGCTGRSYQTLCPRRHPAWGCGHDNREIHQSRRTLCEYAVKRFCKRPSRLLFLFCLDERYAHGYNEGIPL